ncbi:cation transporter [Candidatus Sumerlaeota bacterium]|nr:cation transporter [Candidatus Sumerlaeota bacterium]
MSAIDVHTHGRAERALRLVLTLNASYMVVEFVAGALSGSLALLSDAGHMLSDVGAVTIALIASHISRRSASRGQTYGYGRAEVLAALINGLILWLLVGAIFLEAIKRLFSPPEIPSQVVLGVGAAGLALNIAGVFVLFRHRGENLNLRGAFLHVAADSLGSVGVIVAAFLMLQFKLYIADPLVSFGIGALILCSSSWLIKESVHILLEGTPRHVSVERIRSDLQALEGIERCHDLHIWLIGSGEPVLTAHLDASPNADRTKLLREATEMLARNHNIRHVTIQLETEPLPDSPHC